MRRALLVGVAALLGLSSFGCSDTEPVCCPITEPAESGGCNQLGGAVSSDGTCRSICDASTEDWELVEDEQGCLRWETHDGPFTPVPVGPAQPSEPPAECCPITDPPEPGGCNHVGGSPIELSCQTVCDASTDGWVLTHDENGCSTWDTGD